MQLRVGLTPVGKVVTAVVGGAVIGFSVFFVLLVSGMAGSMVSASEPGTEEGFELPPDVMPSDGFAEPPSTELFPTVFGVLGTVIPVLIALVAIFVVLHGLRYGARLDDTTVTVRSALRTSRVDLAKADRFWLDERLERAAPNMHGYRVAFRTPLLCAQDANGIAKIPLAQFGRHLPSPERQALADAIAKGQPSRGTDTIAQAQKVIEHLRGSSAGVR